jgi:hypothetical protein
MTTIDAKEDPRDAARLKLFEAAATVATEESDKALAALNSMDRSLLSTREEGLLYAALAVSREVRRPPAPVKAAPPSEGTDKSAAGGPERSATLKKAEDAIANVDQLLKETVK